MQSELHHRSHERLRQYWDGLRGDKQFPSEGQIDPDELNDIWPSCYLINVDDAKRKMGYRYSYLGKDLIEAYGEDLNNPDVVGRLLSTSSIQIAKRFDEVLVQKKPVIDESEFINLKNVRIRYRTCMLPLGDAGGNVTHIIGCMRWKVY